MGVRGLETFLQNQVPNGLISINVLEEIDRRKRLADIFQFFYELMSKLYVNHFVAEKIQRNL